MMEIVMCKLRWLFSPRVPPAASEWDENEYNRQLKRTLDYDRANLIKQADERSKSKYDRIDSHIAKLKQIKQKIQELKSKKIAHLKIIRDEQADTEETPQKTTPEN